MKDSLAKRLHEVDPDLTIIPGGHHHHHRVTEQDFLAATGVICSSCGKEVFQSRNGLCMACWEKQEDQKLELRDKTGITNWMPLDILKQITHQAKNTR